MNSTQSFTPFKYTRKRTQTNSCNNKLEKKKNHKQNEKLQVPSSERQLEMEESKGRWGDPTNPCHWMSSSLYRENLGSSSKPELRYHRRSRSHWVGLCPWWRPRNRRRRRHQLAWRWSRERGWEWRGERGSPNLAWWESETLEVLPVEAGKERESENWKKKRKKQWAGKWGFVIFRQGVRGWKYRWIPLTRWHFTILPHPIARCKNKGSAEILTFESVSKSVQKGCF